MAQDTWFTRAVPILEVLAAHEGETMISFGDIATETGLDAAAVDVEIDRLVDGEYIGGKINKPFGPRPSAFRIYPVRLLERGARTVGLWPEDAYAAFVAALEQRIAEEPDEHEKTRLQTLLATVGEIGRGVLTSVLAEVAKSHI